MIRVSKFLALTVVWKFVEIFWIVGILGLIFITMVILGG